MSMKISVEISGIRLLVLCVGLSSVLAAEQKATQGAEETKAVLPPPGSRLLWDGDSPESSGVLQLCRVSGTVKGVRGKCLEAWWPGKPKRTNPVIFFGSRRPDIDLSGFDEIWFYVKASEEGKTFDVELRQWSGRLARVNLNAYLEGGKLTTKWKLVKIPLKDFVLSGGWRNVTDHLVFPTLDKDRSKLPEKFYLDELYAVKAGSGDANKASAGGQKPAGPNFVLILSDDQSWVGTSVPMMASRADSASDFFRTPQLERLAAQGMVFSDGYAPAPQCSPSRHSIQFGKTPARLRNTCHNKTRNPCLAEISIAQMIKAANPNYRTAHFGKWHIGGRTCSNMGYDVSDGETGNGNGNLTKVGNKKQRWPDDNPKQIFGLTKRASDFMHEQVETGHPFYLQISHYATHVENQSRKATEEKYRNLPPGKRHNPNDYETTDNPNTSFLKYAGMTEDLDTGVGMVLDKIEELGIKDDTFVIYMADNGGYRVNFAKLNKPLAGGKTTLWEGGVRVPMIVSGPGIKGGTTCNTPVIGYDIFPTISELIGNETPLPEGIDGGSWRPLFESDGKAKVERPMEELVFHFPFYYSPQSTIRQGDLKLVKDWVSGEVFLFDLSNSISEVENLAFAMPEKTDELYEKMMSYLEDVDAETIDVLKAESKRLGKVLTRSER